MSDSLDINYDELDPGVRDLVRWLRVYWNLNTTDSGDGVSKPAEARVMDVPHVMAVGDRDTLVEIAWLLHERWKPYEEENKLIEVSWNVATGTWMLSLVGFTNADVEVDNRMYKLKLDIS